MSVQISRRQALLAGVSVMVGAGIGLPAFAADGDLPDSLAYAPWRNWQGAEGGGSRSLVDTAILAANAHDTQPWLFCVHPDRIDLYADEGRNLGAMDSFRREMRISLGCALENLRLSARARGFAARLTLDDATLTLPAPTNGSRRVASASFVPAQTETSVLYRAIPARHTNRGPYDRERPIPADLIARLGALAADDDRVRLFLFTDEARRSEFAAATVNATEAIINDPEMINDSDSVWASSAEIEAHRDDHHRRRRPFALHHLHGEGVCPPSPERAHRIWLEADAGGSGWDRARLRTNRGARLVRSAAGDCVRA